MDFETLYQRYARDVYRFALYLSGRDDVADDISAETFVRAWLSPQPIREGTAFAESLRSESGVFSAPSPALPPDHQAKTLESAKRRLARRSPLRLVALAFTGLAIARVVEATTFTKPPREVIGLAVAAVLTWIAYSWHTRWLQQRAMFGPRAGSVQPPR